MVNPGQLNTRDCLDAIEIGARILASQPFEDAPFKLVGAVNLLKGASPPLGPSVWLLTFKPERLIPSNSAGIVGAGGELSLRIDLARSDNLISVVRGE